MAKINITGLFGRFNYSLDIKESGITILTGSNGYGKSTIIHCIDAIGKSDLEFFFDTIYDEIEVSRENEQKKLTIAAKDDCVVFNEKVIHRKYLLHLKRGTAPVKTEKLTGEFIKEKRFYKEILNIMKEIFGDVFFISEHRIVKNSTRKYMKYANG